MQLNVYYLLVVHDTHRCIFQILEYHIFVQLPKGFNFYLFDFKVILHLSSFKPQVSQTGFLEIRNNSEILVCMKEWNRVSIYFFE